MDNYLEEQRISLVREIKFLELDLCQQLNRIPVPTSYYEQESLSDYRTSLINKYHEFMQPLELCLAEAMAAEMNGDIIYLRPLEMPVQVYVDKAYKRYLQ